jgi:VCBS repeat-containing protein
VEPDGSLVFDETFPEAGDTVASADIPQGAEISRVRTTLAFDSKRGKKKSKRCKREFVRKGKRCVSNRPVIYGTSSLHIPGVGTYKITVKPGATALAALKKGKTLHVQVTITFHSTRGGTPTSKIYSLTVKGKKPKPKKHRHKKH